MSEAHSEYGASSFEAARLCPGKPVLEEGRPDRSTSYADEGTAAHWVLEQSLLNRKPAAAYVGRIVQIAGGSDIEVTLEMAGHVQTALDAIEQIAGTLDVQAESRSNYASYLGIDASKAWGTADVTYLRGDELQVMDLKYGMGVVVDVVDIDQLKLYALGKLTEARLLGEEPTSARLVILQPRIKASPSEWTISVEELEAWGYGAARSAVNSRINAKKLHKVHVLEGTTATKSGWERTFLNPNTKSCKFCKAKAVCPALRDQSLDTVVGFAPTKPAELAAAKVPGKDLVSNSGNEWIGAALAKADLIEEWLSAVRSEAHAALSEGQDVPGFKLVTGKRGNRQWADADEAKAALEGFGKDAFTEPQLISPAVAEKLCKKVGIPLPATTQSEGRPIVAPESDPRPALSRTPANEMFSDVRAESLV